MNEEFDLKDIANELVVLNKYTVDTLYSLESGSDCIALYIFYYKTAKWQKTNIVKANDEYIKKSLKWGIDKIKRIKEILKEQGLIQTVKKVNTSGKIDGWYVKISYLVSDEKIEKLEPNHNTQKPLVVKTTSGCEETNALIYKIKMLEDNIKMLKEENNKLNNILNNKENTKENADVILLDQTETMFEEFWKAYPRKVNKKGCFEKFKKIKNLENEFKIIMSALEEQKKSKQWEDIQFIPHPATWLNQERWKNEESPNTKNSLFESIDMKGW